MQDITLENIAKTVEQVLKQELDPIKTRLDNIESTQAIHTAALEQLTSEKKDNDHEKAVNTHRLERLETWGKQVGDHVGIKLEV